MVVKTPKACQRKAESSWAFWCSNIRAGVLHFALDVCVPPRRYMKLFVLLSQKSEVDFNKFLLDNP